MEKTKIDFIVCINNEKYFEECRSYIRELEVPLNCEVGIIPKRNVKSICSAYNEAMYESKAKYKVYLHQDVYIRNRKFIREIIERFEVDEQIGMIGVIGVEEIPKDGFVFDSWNKGMVDIREPDMSYYCIADKNQKEDMRVSAIDGLLIATQYDIQWREDLFEKFDYYDISQACEFMKKGYQIIVPYQGEVPWVIHHCEFAKLKNYEHERDIFVKEYSEFLVGERKYNWNINCEYNAKLEELGEEIKSLIEGGEWTNVRQVLEVYQKSNLKATKLEQESIFMKLHDVKGKEQSIFKQDMLYEEWKEIYMRICSKLRAIEIKNNNQVEKKELREIIKQYQIGLEEMLIIIIVNIINKNKVLQAMKDMYDEAVVCTEIERLIKTEKFKESVVAYAREHR